MQKSNRRYRAALFVAVTLMLAIWTSAGSLNPPPGPVAPSMIPLDTVEPRTPISVLPFSINAAGSYYVTDDLTGVAGQSGITINTSSVTLDLSGFTLHGVPGSVHGVFVASPQININIRNGIISGWDGIGLNMLLASSSSAEKVETDDNECGAVFGEDTDVMYMQANNNADDGITTGQKCVVTNLSACMNGSYGIKTGGNCTITNCESSKNMTEGFSLGDSCTITNCTATGNVGIGLLSANGATARGSTISNCTASNNDSHGIATANGSTVLGCTSSGNGGDGIIVGIGCTVANCTTRLNVGDGIEAGANCRIATNDSTGNGAGAGDGAGIHLASTSGGGTRIEANNVAANDRGIDVDSTGNVIIKNTAAAGGIPYDIVAGNTVGVVISAVGNGSFASSNAWANLVY